MSKRNQRQLTEHTRQILFAHLGGDIGEAQYCWNQYLSLVAAINDYQPAMDNSPNFWRHTMLSYAESARTCLHRAYDSHRSGLSLHQLISRIKHTAITAGIAESEINADLQLVGIKDSLVKKFKWRRDNLHAHKSWDNIVNQSLGVFNNWITNDEFSQLIERAKTIFDKYAAKVVNTDWCVRSYDDDEYKSVLEACKEYVERKRKQT